jgi:hypothetical protein
MSSEARRHKAIWSVPKFWQSSRSPNDPYVEAFRGDYSAEQSDPTAAPAMN